MDERANDLGSARRFVAGGAVAPERGRRVQDARVRAMLVGESPEFLRAIENLDSISCSNQSVLIDGETGSGKELVARSIHYLSNRSGGAFIPVNCGALPDTLLEDEFFGHERGAFTNAVNRRLGLFAEADGGTLFLDEVDALSARGQVALLRVLQDRRFRPLGANKDVGTDVRILAATNAALDRLSRGGSFRADLMYRLCVFRISLPPLRRRQEDIGLLAGHFLQKHAPDKGLAFSGDANVAMSACEWPGNIRELENAVIRACYLSRGGWITAEDLGLAAPGVAADVAATGLPKSIEPMQVQKRRIIEDFERSYLRSLMAAHSGNVSRAARTAQKERRELGKLLKKHGINPGQFAGVMGAIGA